MRFESRWALPRGRGNRVESFLRSGRGGDVSPSRRGGGPGVLVSGQFSLCVGSQRVEVIVTAGPHARYIPSGEDVASAEAMASDCDA